MYAKLTPKAVFAFQDLVKKRLQIVKRTKNANYLEQIVSLPVKDALLRDHHAHPISARSTHAKDTSERMDIA